MDYFGINSADELPKIKEVLADQIIEPTRVHHTEFEQSESLSVSDAGELVDVKNEEENANEDDHLNGHNFDMQVEEESNSQEEGESNSQEVAEDLPSEKASEEFIADETFIEGDEDEEAEDTEEEIADLESNEGDAPEEETDSSLDEGSDDEEDSEEKKEK